MASPPLEWLAQNSNDGVRSGAGGSAVGRVMSHYFHETLPASVLSIGDFFIYCWRELDDVQRALCYLVCFVATCFLIMQVLIPAFTRLVVYPPTAEDLVQEGKDILQKHGTGGNDHYKTSSWANLQSRLVSLRVLYKFKSAIQKDCNCIEAYIVLATEHSRQHNFEVSLATTQQGIDRVMSLVQSKRKEGDQNGNISYYYTSKQLEKLEQSLRTLQLETRAMATEENLLPLDNMNVGNNQRGRVPGKAQSLARQMPSPQQRKKQHSLAHQINIGQFEGMDGYRPVSVPAKDIAQPEYADDLGGNDMLIDIGHRQAVPEQSDTTNDKRSPGSKMKEK
jgi:hypothetical protein